MMEASSWGNRSIGWRVISRAMVGVWQHSKKECSFRISRNSASQLRALRYERYCRLQPVDCRRVYAHRFIWHKGPLNLHTSRCLPRYRYPIRYTCSRDSPGKYLPACLITQTPALSVSSPPAALSTKSFLKAGKLSFNSFHPVSPASLGVVKVLESGIGSLGDMILIGV